MPKGSGRNLAHERRQGKLESLRSARAVMAALLLVLGLGLQMLLAAPAAAHGSGHAHHGEFGAAARTSSGSAQTPAHSPSAAFDRQMAQQQSSAIHNPQCPNHCGHECSLDGMCCFAGCAMAIDDTASPFMPWPGAPSKSAVPQQETHPAAISYVVPRPPNGAA